MMKNIKKLSLTLILSVFSLIALNAQNVGVRIMPNETSNKNFNVTIFVENGNAKITAENAPVIDACTLVSGPEVTTTRNMEIQNGQQVRVTTREYTFVYSTENPGRIIVPSVNIEVNGKTMETPSKTFTLTGSGKIE